MPDKRIERSEWTFHSFASLFPMMDEAALAELAADIKAESQREPIFLWRDMIIDGRNRYEACKLAGVEPLFKAIEFPGGEAEALAYVVSRNLKRRHLTKPQRDVVIHKLRSMPEWASASNRAIAKQIGVSEPTVRRALSASSDADANKPLKTNDQPPERRIVHRGDQQYPMTAPRQPAPVREPEPEARPLTFEDTADAAEARAKEYVEGSARAVARAPRNVRIQFGMLDDVERRKFLAEVNPPKAITLDDVLAWRMDALDSHRCTVADAYFDATGSHDEKRRHADKVLAWLDEHERGDAAKG